MLFFQYSLVRDILFILELTHHQLESREFLNLAEICGIPSTDNGILALLPDDFMIGLEVDPQLVQC